MAANLSYNPKVSFFGELKMRLKYKLLPQITPLRMCLLFCNCYNILVTHSHRLKLYVSHALHSKYNNHFRPALS